VTGFVTYGTKPQTTEGVTHTLVFRWKLGTTATIHGRWTMSDFKKAMTDIINMHCMENGSDTPDYILAQYLLGCLVNFDTATMARDKWHGHSGLTEKLGLDEPLGDPKGVGDDK